MWIVQIVNLDISKNELVQCVSAAQCKCEISGLLFILPSFSTKVYTKQCSVYIRVQGIQQMNNNDFTIEQRHFGHNCVALVGWLMC